MARQLIICCDGTNNNLTGRHNDTNVTKLCELLCPEQNDQLLYYDPGVGNPGELPGATAADRWSRGFERLYGLAFGKGIYENIAEAYRFLMRNYRAGDQIFLYGFSRGAFTARSIGGMVTSFGILRPDMDGLVPTLLHVYFSDREKAGGKYNLIRKQITQLFAADAAQNARVWFVGVWDTVASVGAPLISRSITGTPTIRGKKFQHVRQALALDEHRRAFAPRLYVVEAGYDYAACGQSIAQEWFSGSHADVGGGYQRPEAALSDTAWQWMMQQSVDQGLRLRNGLVQAQTGRVDTDAVAAWMAQRIDAPATAVARVHSETYPTPWWALAGLQVRDTRCPTEGAGTHPVEPPQEHPSVAQRGLAYPRDTVWESRSAGRALGSLALATLLALVCWVVGAALLLTPAAGAQAGLLAQLGQLLWVDLPLAARAYADLSLWLLAWFRHAQLPGTALQALQFQRVAGAVLVDFLFILAYGYLVARVFSWAFARVAGLRRALHTPGVWLNRLGMGACVLVLGDVTENLCMLALLLLGWLGNASWLWGLVLCTVGVLMSLASLAKWLGLLACLALLLWALCKRPAAA